MKFNKKGKIGTNLWKCYNCTSKFTTEELLRQDYMCSKCGTTIFTRK